MNIFITGVAGFIGSNLAEFFLEQGHIVFGCDNFIGGSRSNIANFKRNFNFFDADIRNLHQITSCLQNVDAVIHLAAISSIQSSLEKPLEVAEHNLNGFLNVLEACRNAKVQKLIYASSAAVYGNVDKLPIHENALKQPLSPYGYYKLMNEEFAKMYENTYGLLSVGLRFFNVYGPKQNPKSPYSGVISKWMEEISHDRNPKIYGDGSASRDFIYVKDVCHSIQLVLEGRSPKGGRVYNVGSGTKTSLRELLKNLLKIYQKNNLEPTYEEELPGSILHSCADISDLKRDFKFNPQYTLDSGLEDCFNLLKSTKF